MLERRMVERMEPEEERRGRSVAEELRGKRVKMAKRFRF